MIPLLIGGAVALGAVIIGAAASEDTSYSSPSPEYYKRDDSKEKEARARENLDAVIEQERLRLNNLKQRYNVKSIKKESIKGEKTSDISAVGASVGGILAGISAEIPARTMSSGLDGSSDMNNTLLPRFTFKMTPQEGSNEKLRTIKYLTGILTEEISSINDRSGKYFRKRKLDGELKQTLLGYVSEEKIKDLEKFLESASETRPHIAATGLLNAGKSTLMNSLTGDMGNQRFKTGVVRETTKEKIYEHEGVLFVDTPGLDHNSKDEKIAVEALKQADVILVTHSMNTGGLDAPEMQFFRSIQQNWENPKEFASNAICVLTHLDGMEENQRQVEEEVQKQFAEVFLTKPDLVSVSSTRYQKGMQENKPLLVKKSNYAILQTMMKEKLATAQKNKQRRFTSKIKKQAEEIRDVLRNSEVKLSEEISIIKQNKANFSKEIKKSNERIASAWQEI